ncbi:uncharacterized protein MAM_03554 [Metarhizium album ARSEF 1941]|uniref:Uncharacterized protein n=1 Tax=Metarhizium album (strain ARSEF 1941) TaxID=1081103 RepID=A0A0B2X018_METAS|nr:uncharacterized protein MAM_03554 [Metarhizium album ARSEF 1941]KHN98430.1 hypothetical protein MAM_03554 [Metarhizium album ARSEF 1941]
MTTSVSGPRTNSASMDPEFMMFFQQRNERIVDIIDAANAQDIHLDRLIIVNSLINTPAPTPAPPNHYAYKIHLSISWYTADFSTTLPDLEALKCSSHIQTFVI